ncbi:hypothetical protein [Azospirillum sp. TSO5]|uniref:hypothetical protein n=1 Tax=Azospirillum sp. TSO5 TaxID=716760 RepID=UPI000D6066AD|nr:hypothetical protein [Azospirillum sp. TSO5]PWC92935.1 hypothetical protein TSO5_16030 [Azospirillum sp. TSO5]
MKLPAPPPPALSDLPLVQAPSNLSKPKQRRGDGAWYGFSKQTIRDAPGKDAPLGTEVVVSHLEHDGRCYQNPSPRPERWDAVARHQIAVRVWFRGQRIAKAHFKRYAVGDNYDMTFPTIWASGKTDVDDDWQRRGVAKTIYAHLKGYDFKIAPAPVLLSEGRKLWTGGLDPNVSKEDVPGHGRFAVRKPPLPLPPPQHDGQLAELLARFEVPTTLRERLKPQKKRRDFVAGQAGEVYAVLRAALADTFADPDEALALLLNDFRADEAVAELLAKEPAQFGELKNPPPSGFRGWFRRAPEGPKDILVSLKMARKTFTETLLADDERHRCTYEDDCKAWIGRTIRVPTDE